MRGLISAILICSAFTGWGNGVERDSARAAGRRDTLIKLILELEKPCPSFSLEPAPLRYNKDFSFSLTFDDGLASAYLVAFPYFNGGRVSASYMDQWGHDQGGDGLDYPGLFYTDGCGNRKPFQAALAINAASITGGQGDEKAGNRKGENPGNLSWAQLQTMYAAGWDIYNHGYNHATGTLVDAPSEVRKNNEAVFEHFHFTMNQFVVPGGKDDHISQEPYARAAFEQGLLAVHCGNFKEDWDLAGSLDSMRSMHSIGSMRSMRAGRKFLSSKWLNGRPDSSFFTDLSGRLKDGKKSRINAFTHSVGNDDLWGISLRFADLKIFFEELAARYGEKGKDNMWMATYQAVQEYQLICNNIVYSIKKEKNRVILSFDAGKLTDGLRHKALSFVWKAGIPVKKVSCVGCVVESYTKASRLQERSKTENLSQIINIQW